MLFNDDRRVGAGADESLGETLPDDQVATTILGSNDLCREPSIVPDRLRIPYPNADEVWNLALVWCRCRCCGRCRCRGCGRCWCRWWAPRWRIHIVWTFALGRCPVVEAEGVNDAVEIKPAV